MRVYIVSDNRAAGEGFISKHTFSIFIERRAESYLFDMGVDPDVLEHNTSLLGIALDTVDYVVIVSHKHTPHYGGFSYVAQEAPYVTTLIPYGSSETLGRLLVRAGLKPLEVTKWTMLRKDIYVSRQYYGPPMSICS